MKILTITVRTKEYAMEIDRLLEHSDWVRKLASNLVNDPDEADDLVQQTWTAALETPPRDGSSSRGWLARVLRNFAYSGFRRRSRRRSRERAAATIEAVPSAESSVEKLEISRLLIELVFELAEPGRTTVVLRYFEGLTSGEIASRLDTSPGAVRMRLKRALSSLRAQLEERCGERGDSWKMLLLPLVGSVGVPAMASDAVAAGSSRVDVAGGGTALSGLSHAVVMTSIAVSCFAGGWRLGDAGDESVALVTETVSSLAASPLSSPPMATPLSAVPGGAIPVEARRLENRIEELEARLETSRRRLAEKTREILELKTRLAARVTAGRSTLDPA